MTSVHTVENGTKGKVCSACREWKSLSEFGRHKGIADGLTCRCKICRYRASSLSRKTPEGRVKQAACMRRYRQTESGQVAYRRVGRNNRTKYPVKMFAGSAVAHAVATGRLPRVSSCTCADCGKQAEYHHHESYEKEYWLDVIPLCRGCHIIRHEKKVS